MTLKKTSTNLSENVYNLGGTNLVTAARQTKTTQLEPFPAYFTPTEDMGPPKNVGQKAFQAAGRHGEAQFPQ